MLVETNTNQKSVTFGSLDAGEAFTEKAHSDPYLWCKTDIIDDDNDTYAVELSDGETKAFKDDTRVYPKPSAKVTF